MNNKNSNNRIGDKSIPIPPSNKGRDEPVKPVSKPAFPRDSSRTPDIEKRTQRIEDILAESGEKKFASPTPLKSKSPPPSPLRPKEEEPSPLELKKTPPQRKILTRGIIILGIIILGVAAYFLYQKFFKSEEVSLNNNLNQGVTIINENVNKGDQINKRANFNVNQPLDTDKDGLSDEEETNLGTNINNSDSDNDNLFDFEEAKIYQTDPLNSDTDGDGHSDGEEVKKGYNPKGPGLLRDLEKEIQKIEGES